MKVHVQFVRFGVVGLICYVVGLALLTFLTEVAEFHYLLSFVVSFVLTNLLGYWLNGRFSFRVAEAMNGRAATRYVAVSSMSLIANTAALAALVELLEIWYVAAVVALTAVNLPINFLVHRVISYRIGRVTSRRAEP